MKIIKHKIDAIQLNFDKKKVCLKQFNANELKVKAKANKVYELIIPVILNEIKKSSLSGNEKKMLKNKLNACKNTKILFMEILGVGNKEIYYVLIDEISATHLNNVAVCKLYIERKAKTLSVKFINTATYGNTGIEKIMYREILNCHGIDIKDKQGHHANGRFDNRVQSLQGLTQSQHTATSLGESHKTKKEEDRIYNVTSIDEFLAVLVKFL